MSQPRVLILGANGRFGACATQAFAQAGWLVWAQMRRAPSAPLPAGATVLPVPLADTATLAAQAAGATVVVYAVNPIYTRWDSDMLPLARQGMAVAQSLGACFMLPGNVYNFGPSMPALLHEDTPQQPSTPKGFLRCTLEAEMQAQAASGRMSSVVVRAGDFYGAGHGSWLDQLIVKGFRAGKLAYPGPLNLAHAWAYLPDLARAFVAVASRPAQAGSHTEPNANANAKANAPPSFERFHFAGHSLTGHEFLQHIDAAAGRLGLRPTKGFRHGGLPWGLLRTVGVVYPRWRELARMAYLWQVPHALDGTALQRTVGPLPNTPPAQAMHQALLDLGLSRQTHI
jgi:nucleoside-diphosphate-sugar epimerase